MWRLYIIAGLSALVVAAAAWVANLSNQLDRAREAEAKALEAQALASVELDRWRAEAERQGQIIARLDEMTAQIRRESEQSRRTLQQLTEANQDVQDALSRAYPIELVCLLDAENGLRNPACADPG